tara:strand:+ start:394 stop:684 length:291 start_codon:yes stop_codon:yes gene_type:complete
MTIRVILTYEKQEDGGDFINIPQNVIDLLEKYKEDGKLVDYSKEEEPKKITYTMNWKDSEGKTEFRSEREVLSFADEANTHNFENKIYSTLDEFYV